MLETCQDCGQAKPAEPSFEQEMREGMRELLTHIGPHPSITNALLRRERDEAIAKLRSLEDDILNADVSSRDSGHVLFLLRRISKRIGRSRGLND